MLSPPIEARRAKRIALPLPCRVEIQEEKDVWRREITHLINVSGLGASFFARRALAVGQLLLLTMPMPRGLRSFDHSEDKYMVWCIVCHCNAVSAGDSGYHIGVAFIGKNPPPSFFENPQRLYKLSGVSGNGLWQIGEDSRPFADRCQERYNIPLTIYLAVFDHQNNKVLAHETTVTENISRSGASVFSTLPVKVGDFVKVGCDQYNGFLTAEVRDLRTGEDGLPRLHLQFIGAEFPLEGIEQD